VSIPAPDLHDLIENAPCGFIVLNASSRVEHVNRTFLGWSGHSADHVIGKRFSDFLTLPGRIYFETHISPLLRMQGFFNEFAIDVLTAGGDPMHIIANANERRDPDGNALSVRIALIKATDRRRYETELLSARELA
jgi:sigma-B regulation protein RsbU (phosphoserine phosphatase)